MKEFSTLSAAQAKQYGKRPYNFLISGSRDPADTPSDRFITPHPDPDICFLNSKAGIYWHRKAMGRKFSEQLMGKNKV
jgi:hypothetical protein